MICSVLFRANCFKNRAGYILNHRMLAINIGVTLSVYRNMYEWIKELVFEFVKSSGSAYSDFFFPFLFQGHRPITPRWIMTRPCLSFYAFQSGSHDFSLRDGLYWTPRRRIWPRLLDQLVPVSHMEAILATTGCVYQLNRIERQIARG